MPVLAWLVFVAAAALEVGGDAVVRQGLRGTRPLLVALGALLVAGYGLVVNLVPWEFSKLLGVYVAVFAVVSVLAGQLVFSEDIPASTWAGLGLIVAGGLVIQFGHR
jgi:small multidrug resistance family-3 protein